jgi:ABC-type transporter Mla subunit MlaD
MNHFWMTRGRGSPTIGVLAALIGAGALVTAPPSQAAGSKTYIVQLASSGGMAPGDVTAAAAGLTRQYGG